VHGRGVTSQVVQVAEELAALRTGESPLHVAHVADRVGNGFLLTREGVYIALIHCYVIDEGENERSNWQRLKRAARSSWGDRHKVCYCYVTTA